MPSRNAAALIGKIGDRSTDYCFVGDETGLIRAFGCARIARRDGPAPSSAL